jgi:elongation factor 2
LGIKNDQLTKKHMSVQADKIRNITVAAQVDAGKTTLTDSLLNTGSLISQKDSGDKCATDTMKQEQDRGITIKSMGVSVKHKDHLINIIDSPGHVDFSSEVTAAVRVTDGVLVLINAIDGVMVQTSNVVRQAISDKSRPILIINKCDRLIKELQKSSEEIYDVLLKDIAQVNTLLAEFNDDDLGNLELDPIEGNVLFSSAYHQWGFRLNDLECYYSQKLGMSGQALRKFLWKRANFCRLVLDPIKKIYDMVEKRELDEVSNLLKKINVKHSNYNNDDSTKSLIRIFMSSWLPAGDNVLNMVIDKLPSPIVAQKYRSRYLYQGSRKNHNYTDAALEGMKNCDPNGPLVVYISKMIPDRQNSRFYAFGRVFSGTVRSGQKVQVVTADHRSGDRTHESICQQIAVVMAGKMEACEEVLAGNTIAIMGLDRFIVKSATILDNKVYWPIRDMVYLVAPVVRVAISPKSNKDLNKFEQAIQKLRRSDPLLLCYLDKSSGDYIIAGSGELHVEVSLSQLRDDFAAGIEIITKDPVVNYQETIINNSTLCLAKSSNKHNRLFMRASPLPEEFVKAVESGEIESKPRDPKAQAGRLHDEFGMNRERYGSKRFWGFGPDEKSGNTIIDGTSAVEYMHESQNNIIPGFQEACRKGPLCEEPVRGVEFIIEDAKLHSDSVHRGGDQLIPTTRQAVHSCLMNSGVRLVEPIFLANISVPRNMIGSVYQVLNHRRGEIVCEEIQEGTQLNNIQAYLPVADCFGFDAELKETTSGRALPQLNFSHWKVIEGDPLKEGNYANKVALAIRKRKGLDPNFPVLEQVHL